MAYCHAIASASPSSVWRANRDSDSAVGCGRLWDSPGNICCPRICGNALMAQAAINILLIVAAIAAVISLVDSALRAINFVKESK